MKKLVWFTFPIIVIMVVWELISRSGIVSIALFPPPSKVTIAFWGMIVSGTIFSDIGSSICRLGIGLVIGSTIGTCIGLLTGRIKLIAKLLNPIIQILRPLPPVAITPLIIIWFGIDNGAKIFSIAFATFFPVWVSAYSGSQQVPQTFLWSAKLFTISKLRMFREVVFPASLPFIISGIRTAIAIGFVMVFVSELSGASSGLGYRISITSLSYRIDEMIAVLIVLGTMGALTDQIFVFITRKVFPWLTLSSK